MDESLKKIEQGAFFLIAGPCVIENEETPIEIATYLEFMQYFGDLKNDQKNQQMNDVDY